MLDMFSFRGKSKNFLKLQELLNKSEQMADKFFDKLPIKEQIRLIDEAQDYLIDQEIQDYLKAWRKSVESTLPSIGFSNN